MPEGTLCNKTPVNTKEQLQALLADKSGKQYYEEMNDLEVNSQALWLTVAYVPKAAFTILPTSGIPSRFLLIRFKRPWVRSSDVRGT
jgi:hypothetical protein